ncbi:MAG: glycosyltransferase family 4 protein [Elusimicrobia bacterium]|nr:glycosyltransferase family 4 protein [Elusimicrobiota bacterium]
MKVLICLGTALEKINGDFYAAESWFKIPEGILRSAKELTLWVPVIERPAGFAVPREKWRVKTEGMRIVALDYFNSYVSYARLWPSRNWAWKRVIRHLAQQHDIVVVHVPTPLISIIVAAVYRVKKSLVAIVVGDMVSQSERIIASRGVARLFYVLAGKFLAWQEARCLRRADKIWVYNRALADRHRHNASVELLEDPILSGNDFVERLDTCQGPVVRLLRVCWLLPSKGLEYLIQAVAILKKQDRPVYLEILGKEKQRGYQDRLAQLVNNLDIGEQVVFSGWAPFDQLGQAYLRSDIQVISSLAEGTPRCIVEGMARGLPLVASSVGGCQDTLTHEQNALLVPPADPEAIAAAVGRLIDDGHLRRRLISSGYLRAGQATFETAGAKLLASLRDLAPAAREIAA